MSVMQAAEATPLLAGRRVRRYNALAVLLVALCVAMLPAVITLDPVWVAGGGAAFIALMVPVLLHAQRAARLNNRGVERLMCGDDDEAARAFAELATGRYTRDAVQMALMNLGVVALRRVDFASAAKLLAASIEAAGGFRLAIAPDLYSGLARAHLALALAATGDLDGARRELRAAHAVPTIAMAIAYVTRARAYVSLAEGNLAATLQTIDAERELLRNVLTSREAALAQAIEAVALAEMQSRHGAAPRAPEPIVVDADERAFVLALLPTAAPHLVAER